MNGRRAVIFDKDGTLIEDVPYNVDPALMRLTAGAAQAVRALNTAGYAVMVASNQSGVARGYFPEAALQEVAARLRRLLESEDASLDAFLYCPHLPGAACAEYALECSCRKPAPGLLERAADIAGADPEQCWMVGDILDDVEAGNRAGMRTILVDNGHETEWRYTPLRWPSHLAESLPAAARIILATDMVAPDGALAAMSGSAS